MSGGELPPLYLLTDNGSIRAASALALRETATRLSALTGQQVEAASLAHCDKIDPTELGNTPALRLADHLLAEDLPDARPIVILPFFLATGGAIVRLLHKALAEIRDKRPQLQIRIAPFLFDEDGTHQEILALACKDRIEEQLNANDEAIHPNVILVDHGSPFPVAAQVRNFVAGQIQAFLHHKVRSVIPASMERREGTQYDFTAPTLSDVLQRPHIQQHPVILSYFFLLPGRHAGAGGDIAEILDEARQQFPNLSLRTTGLLGDHPLILNALAKRINSTCGKS